MRYLITIFAVLLLASCSVKKRTYRDGYYIDWAFKKKNIPPPKRTGGDLPTEIRTSSEIVLASNGDIQGKDLIQIGSNTKFLVDTCGDIIFFRSGDQVVAKVVEITEEKIKYKRCDNLDGPSFVVSKANVISIRYVNGIEEKIEAPIVNNTPTNPQQQYVQPTAPPKVHPKPTWALITVLTLWWLLGVGFAISLYLAQAAIREIKANPKKYRGMSLAKTVTVIDIVFIGLIILGLALG